MGITEKGKLRQLLRNFSSRRRAWQVDRKNIKTYGELAPLFAERIWVRTSELELALRVQNSKASAKVINSWPDRTPENVTKIRTIEACLRHWRDGISWEESGIYELMLEAIRRHGKMDRMKSLEDIRRRYQELDELYDTVQANGSLSTRQDLNPRNFREEGGILVHLGPEGKPYFGKKGHHRLAAAIAAGLPKIPAQLGVVHIDALSALNQFRAASLVTEES